MKPRRRRDVYEFEADLIADCKRAAETLQVYLELTGQYRADKGGQDAGFPDGILHGGGRTLLIEFKRPRTRDGQRGRITYEQLIAAERRKARGVDTYLCDSLEEFAALANYARVGRDGSALRTVLSAASGTA